MKSSFASSRDTLAYTIQYNTIQYGEQPARMRMHTEGTNERNEPSSGHPDDWGRGATRSFRYFVYPEPEQLPRRPIHSSDMTWPSFNQTFLLFFCSKFSLAISIRRYIYKGRKEGSNEHYRTSTRWGKANQTRSVISFFFPSINPDLKRTYLPTWPIISSRHGGPH